MVLKCFSKTLCYLLAAGFVFGGFGSLNKYETDLPLIEKSEVMQPVPAQTSCDLTVKSSIDIDNSNFYLKTNLLSDENIFSSYKDLFLPESDYFINEGRERATKERAREQILRSLGLENTILSGRLYKSSNLDANFNIKLLKIEDLVNPSSDNKNILESFDFTINFKF